MIQRAYDDLRNDCAAGPGDAAIAISPRPTTARRRGDPTMPATVGPAIESYLRSQLHRDDLCLAESPRSFTSGWEAYTYSFRLQAAAPLPAAWDRALVIRIYSSPQGAARARHEYEVQRYLQDQGYPVAPALLIEEDSQYFGGPFLIMTQVAGPTLLHWCLQHPFRLWDMPGRLAAVHWQLHTLPTSRFPATPEMLIQCSAAAIAAVIEEHDLAGLVPGARWLLAHVPEPWPERCILHGDFHPMNVIRTPGKELIVLDWSEATVGDPHADIGTTLMLLDCITAGAETAWHYLGIAMGRGILRRRYLRAYRRCLRLDRSRLRYFRAAAALRRLAMYGRWLAVGPAASGSKPSAIEHLSTGHIRVLANYFRRWTGVAVHLPLAHAEE